MEDIKIGNYEKELMRKLDEDDQKLNRRMRKQKYDYEFNGCYKRKKHSNDNFDDEE